MGDEKNLTPDPSAGGEKAGGLEGNGSNPFAEAALPKLDEAVVNAGTSVPASEFLATGAGGAFDTSTTEAPVPAEPIIGAGGPELTGGSTTPTAPPSTEGGTAWDRTLARQNSGEMARDIAAGRQALEAMSQRIDTTGGNMLGETARGADGLAALGEKLRAESAERDSNEAPIRPDSSPPTGPAEVRMAGQHNADGTEAPPPGTTPSETSTHDATTHTAAEVPQEEAAEEEPAARVEPEVPAAGIEVPAKANELEEGSILIRKSDGKEFRVTSVQKYQDGKGASINYSSTDGSESGGGDANAMLTVGEWNRRADAPAAAAGAGDGNPPDRPVAESAGDNPEEGHSDPLAVEAEESQLEDSAAGDEEPAAGDEEPAAGDEEPAAGDEEPAAGDEEPAAGDEEPAAGDEEPAAGDEEPAAGEPLEVPNIDTNQVEADAIAKGFDPEAAKKMAQIIGNPTKGEYDALSPTQQEYVKNAMAKETFDRMNRDTSPKTTDYDAIIQAGGDGSNRPQTEPVIESQSQISKDVLENADDIVQQRQNEAQKSEELNPDAEFDNMTEAQRINAGRSTDPEVQKRFKAYQERKVKQAEAAELFKGLSVDEKNQKIQDVTTRWNTTGAQFSEEDKRIAKHLGLSANPEEELHKSETQKALDEGKELSPYQKSLAEKYDLKRETLGDAEQMALEIETLEAKLDNGEASAEDIARLNELKTQKKGEEDKVKERDILRDKLKKYGLSPEDQAKLLSLETETKGQEKPLTQEQIDQLGIDFLEKFMNGKAFDSKGRLTPAAESALGKLQKHQIEKALATSGGLSPKEARDAAKQILERTSRGERKKLAIENRVRAKLSELMALEMQAMNIPRQLENWRKAREDLKTQIKNKESEIGSIKPEDTAQAQKRAELNGMMMRLVSTKAQIARVKNMGRTLRAQHKEIMASVKKDLGLIGPVRAAIAWAESRLMDGITEAKMNFDSVHGAD